MRDVSMIQGTRALALTAILAASFVWVGARPVEADTGCGGEAIQIAGSARDDVLVGTDRADVIHGFAGDDDVHGLDAGDSLCGGSGSDVLFDGYGRDFVNGGDGHDTLYKCPDGQTDEIHNVERVIRDPRGCS